MTTPLLSITQAATVAALTTTAQHLLLYDNAAIKPEERYALGVTAIAGAFALYALREGQHEALAALLIIVGAAGLPPLIGYRIRRERAQGAILEMLTRRRVRSA